MLMNVAFLCTVSTDLIACSCPHVSKTHAFRCTSSRWRPQPREVTPNDEMWCWFCCSIYYFYKLYLFIHVSDKIHKLIKGHAYNKLLFWITTFTLIMYYQSNNSWIITFDLSTNSQVGMMSFSTSANLVYEVKRKTWTPPYLTLTTS